MKLLDFRIEGFRDEFIVESRISNIVTYIIGRNGTGKTTLARLLVAAITCDHRHLLSAAFSRIELNFASSSGVQARVIYSRKQDDQIAGQSRQFEISLSVGDVEAVTTTSGWLERRREIDPIWTYADVSQMRLSIDYIEEVELARRQSKHRQQTLRNLSVNATKVREFFTSRVHVRWLPIERAFRLEDSEELRRSSGRPSSPVDVKLYHIQNSLVRYFAELDKQKALELERFRNNSLLALFNVEVSQGSRAIASQRINAIDEELSQLIPELNLDPELEQRFRANSRLLLNWMRDRKGRPVEVLRQSLARLEDVLTYWKEAKEIIGNLLSKRDAFIHSLADAFSLSDLRPDLRIKFAKKPELRPDNEIAFRQSSNSESIEHIRLKELSSGEKQFFILLAEALLERESETIMVVDEPELSLHITWQNRLVDDLRLLNPNVQLVMATHSPDIISTKTHQIIQMEEIARSVQNAG